jgi:hypothetical protein
MEKDNIMNQQEKEEKLKQHIKDYVTFLCTEKVPLDLQETMIQNETKRFKQILENE